MTTGMKEAVAEMEGVRKEYIGRKIKYDGFIINNSEIWVFFYF